MISGRTEGLIGGVIGVGTIITAFFMGPLISWFNVHLSEPMRNGQKSE